MNVCNELQAEDQDNRPETAQVEKSEKMERAAKIKAQEQIKLELKKRSKGEKGKKGETKQSVVECSKEEFEPIELFPFGQDTPAKMTKLTSERMTRSKSKDSFLLATKAETATPITGLFSNMTPQLDNQELVREPIAQITEFMVQIEKPEPDV